MANLLNSIFHEKYVPDEHMMAEIGSLEQIRNHIINSIYLISGILGTFAIYGTLMRILKFGWQPSFIFNFFLYIAVWAIFFFRNKLSLNWKAFLFFILFFGLASSINYTAGIVSGALNFVFITTIITLIYGWKAGVATIILTFLVRFAIGWGYLKGILHYNIDPVAYVNTPAATVTAIVGGLVIASIIVFAINKFYKWLILSLHTLSIKANELTQLNVELLKAKQIAEENDRLKSVFLANMSHEIRTPMNAIIGFSGFLSKPNLSEAKRDRFTTIIQERSYDLIRIIEDILDISKIEVGQMKLFESEFELFSLIQELNDYYKLKKNKLENSKDLELRYSVPDNIKKITIYLDKQRLNQIFTNLLDNAFKFTQKGFIEFGYKIEQDSRLLFWVKDSGIGIQVDKQSIIFDRFRQADDSLTARQYGGTGLGLSIVQGIIKLMEGEIWLESKVGLGTTFYFSLPLKRLENRKL
jgi:signal transduction histidine kinase